MRRSPFSRPLYPCALLAIGAGLAVSPSGAALSTAWAQLPETRLDGVVPAGGQAGQQVEMTIGGVALDDVDQLLFSHNGIRAERKLNPPGPFDAGPQPAPNQFVVSVAPNVPVGNHLVRAKGKFGVSNPRVFQVGALPESTEVEPNNDPPSANEGTSPGVLNGVLGNPADVDCYRITAKGGERVVIECRARAIDSQLRAVVEVSDSSGRVLATGGQGAWSDSLLDFIAPGDGEFTVRVRDVLYGGGPGHVYRLAIGSQPHIDFVFPPAGAPGSNGAYTVYGRNLPGGAAAGLQVDGHALQKLQVQIAVPGNATGQLDFPGRLDPHQAGLDGLAYRVNSPAGASNAQLVAVAGAPVVLEQPGDNDRPAGAQKLQVPCEVAGQFYPRRDVDWYQFDAKQGERLQLEVVSHRLGLPTDPLLVVQQVTKSEAGEETVSMVAQVDDVGNGQRPAGREFDCRTSDPSVLFVAPADATYRVLVRDSYSALHNDPRLVYRLIARPPQPDFRLAATPADCEGGVTLRRGGRAAIRVIAFRQDGFDGDIVVTATGMPAGVTVSEVTIGAGSDTGTLVLTAADNAAAATASLTIVGKSRVGAGEVTRPARIAAAAESARLLQPGEQNQFPSLSVSLGRDLVVSVLEEVESVTLAAGGDKVWETARAGVLKIPYAVVRRNGFNGGINCILQDVPPNVNEQQVQIGGGANAGEFEVRLNANMPPGTYTLQLQGLAQQVSYVYNPEAAQRAVARRMELEKIATDEAAKAKSATEQAAAAKRAADEAEAKRKAAADAKTAADKVLADANAAETAAKQSAATAAAASTAAPTDEGLKTAAANAAKAATDAAVKTKEATIAVGTADKALAEAVTAAEAATKAANEAEQASQQATERSKLADAAKQAATQRATELENQAKPRNLNYWIPSTPIVIKVAESPVTLDGLADKATVKQGMPVEIPVRLSRLFAYQGAVGVTAQLPPGLAGLQVGNGNVADGQTETKLTLTAAANATPGTHQLTLRFTMNFNGQGLTIERPLTLTIEAVEATQ